MHIRSLCKKDIRNQLWLLGLRPMAIKILEKNCQFFLISETKAVNHLANAVTQVRK